jgi:hypothetical protein
MSTDARELLVYNPQKGRLETIEVEFTAENTTWFDDSEAGCDIASITDLAGGLLMRTYSYDYPVLVYDLSRADIGHDGKKARKVMQEYV